MSPASYLTAPPRVTWVNYSSPGQNSRLARRQPRRRQWETVGRADRGQFALGADLPAEHTARVGVQRIEVLAVRAERLVTDARRAVDGRCRHGLAQLDAAVIANRVRRD